MYGCLAAINVLFKNHISSHKCQKYLQETVFEGIMDILKFKYDFPTVNCPSQETEVTSTSTRPVENVIITTKALQDRNNNC